MLMWLQSQGHRDSSTSIPTRIRYYTPKTQTSSGWLGGAREDLLSSSPRSFKTVFVLTVGDSRTKNRVWPPSDPAGASTELWNQAHLTLLMSRFKTRWLFDYKNTRQVSAEALGSTPTFCILRKSRGPTGISGSSRQPLFLWSPLAPGLCFWTAASVLYCFNPDGNGRLCLGFHQKPCL